MTHNRIIAAARTSAAIVTVGLTLAVVFARPMSAANPNPGVLPPNSSAHGLTYGEWSAKWFKWALGQTTANSPLLDTTGANCGVGQSGKVWFLAGTFMLSPPGPPPVVRQCQIPAGQMIFFPVGNAFCAGDGFDFAGERACATAIASGLGGFRAEVDGVSINGLDAPLLDNYYRALSPEFDLVLSADNIFTAPAGTYSPGAADGVYLMLAPLTPGQHTIHFHADISGGGQIDATYYLTVGR